MKLFQHVTGYVGLLLCLVLSAGPLQAAFPDDLSDVIFLEETRGGITGLGQHMRTMGTNGNTLSVRIGGPDAFGGLQVILDSNRRNSWPPVQNLLPTALNANAWLFVRRDGQWYGATWEFMRVGQTTKSTKALVGPRHLRFPPLDDFQLRNGEVYGFMVAGVTRNGLAPTARGIQQRSNVVLYKWGVGPVDEVGEDLPPPVEECVEPEPDLTNRSHVYNGTVRADITASVNGTPVIADTLTESTTITVRDDRSLVMVVDGEVMNAQVQQNGTFSGAFEIVENDLPGVTGECRVSVNVSGTVNGRSISGSGTGADSCGPYSAQLSATFSATSSTAPDYLDQRPTPAKQCVPAMGGIHLLLLEDEPR